MTLSELREKYPSRMFTSSTDPTAEIIVERDGWTQEHINQGGWWQVRFSLPTIDVGTDTDAEALVAALQQAIAYAKENP